MNDSKYEVLVDDGLRQAAQAEMRRILPEDQPRKRAKTSDHALIPVGRFNYGSVNQLAAGLAGFLLTCDFRREMSATREAVILLHPYLASAYATTSVEAPLDSQPQPLLASVKIATRGLLTLHLQPISNNDHVATGVLAQEAALSLMHAVLETKCTKVQHIQRIIPLITTSLLDLRDLEQASRRLANVALPELKAALTFPSFAIGYVNRSHGRSDDKRPESLPQRPDIIAAVAKGFTDELKEKFDFAVEVDLKQPDVLVLVESLPTTTDVYVGLGVLPQRMCILKPRLTAKGLIASESPKAKEKKKGKTSL